MNNVIFFQDTDKWGNTTTHVKIDKGNGEVVWMPKEIYDEMMAGQQGVNNV